MEFLDEKVEICGYRCVECPYDDCAVTVEGKISVKARLELAKRHCMETDSEFRELYERQKAKEEETRRKREEYIKKYNEEKRRGARRGRATTNYGYVVSSDIVELAEIIHKLKDKSVDDILSWLDRDLVNGGLNND